MPALANLLATRAGVALEAILDTAEPLEGELLDHMPTLTKRIYIPCCNSSSPSGLVQAETTDPWQKSGKYALAWVYFCIILLVCASAIRWYQYFNDKIRTALQEEKTKQEMLAFSPDSDFPMSTISSMQSTQKFFPPKSPVPSSPETSAPVFASRTINKTLALVRSVFYRPMPTIRLRKGWRPIILPSLGAITIIVLALILVLGYDLIPQPWYWQSIRYGSPPVAIRAGMIAVAMVPWIIALSMKANFITLLTGIGHERLNVLHRWLAYIFILLSLIHTIPFYITPIWDAGGYRVFRSFFTSQHVYVYGSGISALVAALFLGIHSLPPLRRRFYELFVVIHVPVSILLLATLFWHCHNYLTSWDYLFATVGIWLTSLFLRLFYLNWTNPFRMSWLIGEEAAITLLPANAVKVTIPTQMKWKPGQYVYRRMPGISFFENHPFTIASLCSDDFPSQYGEGYRDMVLVFRPFSGFTRKVVDAALEHGPWHTYRAFLDGPYGGMRRTMESFDHVVMIAGGSGITAIVSQLLDLIKRMRDGKAVTKTVHLIWALKRPETMEWFQEELRICREFAPLNSVSCQFYVTAAKRQTQTGQLVSAQTPGRPVSMVLHEKVNDVFQSIASNRFSSSTSHRNSAFIKEVAAGDADCEKQLREENDDRLRPLPQAHIKHALRALEGEGPPSSPLMPPAPPYATTATPHLPPHPTLHEKRRSTFQTAPPLSLDLTTAHRVRDEEITALPNSHQQAGTNPDFGFPSTPTEFQKNLMRFAFMPAALKPRPAGWSVEWGRPDIPYMLRDLSENWGGGRACVYVCGPMGMREDVGRAVAGLQGKVGKEGLEEVYLWGENYAV